MKKLLLTFAAMIAFSTASKAEPIAVFVEYMQAAGCNFYVIFIYEDHDDADPTNDTYLGAGHATNCPPGGGGPVPPTNSINTDGLHAAIVAESKSELVDDEGNPTGEVIRIWDVSVYDVEDREVGRGRILEDTNGEEY